MKPELHAAVDEPTATGWLRMELYGNADLAERYTHAGRSVLGGLRSRSGVNERIANGESGGFFHQWATLPDGTQIHAMTNDGQDTVRIYSPSFSTTEEEEKDKKTDEFMPYLWVGVHAVQPQDNTLRYYDSLEAMLIEPDGVITIVGRTGQWFTRGYFTDSSGPISDPEAFLDGDIAYYRTSGDENPINEAIGDYNMAFRQPDGQEPLGVYYTGVVQGQVFFSVNGVIGFDCYNQSNNTIPDWINTSIAPFDPTVPANEGTYPAGQGRAAPNPEGWNVNSHWNGVLVLDPTPDDPHPDHVSVRPQEEQVRAMVDGALARNYQRAVQVLPGQYVLKVFINGDCWENVGTPTEVEIEVRLGKPTVETFKTTVSIAAWSKHGLAILPGGSRKTSIFDYPEYGAPNPHGPMWWQGALLIDVERGTVEESAFYAPEPYFTPGTYNTQLDHCTGPIWYPWMLSSFYPGTVPIGDTLAVQAEHFARTFYANTWYIGDQGYDWTTIDWSRYNIAPLTAQIIAYAQSIGRTNLDGTKIIASGYPSTQGTRPNPLIAITEMSNTSSTEWTNLITNLGSIYNGEFHRMRAVF